MLREPSRHDGLPNNQAARDRQRERQRQERAQMLPSDDADVGQTVQDLFNAPVKVKPSIEDPTSIEVRKTFGSYESARPYLMDNHGSLQRRLLGVDSVTASSGGVTHGTVGDSVLRSSSASSGSGLVPKSVPNPPQRPPPQVTTKPDSVFKSIPSSSSTPKGSLSLGSQPHPIPHLIGQSKALSPTISHIQNSIWNVPTPLSPFPQTPRKETKLGTTTLPITFVNTGTHNTFSNSSSEISDLPSRAVKTNQNSQPLIVSPVASKSSGTTNSVSSSSSAVKSEVTNTSASLGAYTTEKSTPEQHNFKKPLERFDSRFELDSMIREMTDVSSPLSVLPTDSPPKKVTRRSSRNDERTLEAMAGMNELKHNPSPISVINSSSSSGSSSSSDSDSDSDSSTASDMTPAPTPVKPATNTARSPTGERNWSLATFVGGIRKENALVGAASTSSETMAASTGIRPVSPEYSGSSSSIGSKSSDLNVSSSSSSSSGSSTAKSNNATATILENTKALNKPAPGFIKPNVPPAKSSKETSSASHSKEVSKPNKPSSADPKRKVVQVPSKPISSLSSTLKKHKDPSLSSDDDDDLPITPSVSAPPKEKEKEKKVKASTKRPSTVLPSTNGPAIKKPRKSTNSSTASTTPPLSGKDKKSVSSLSPAAALPDKGGGGKKDKSEGKSSVVSDRNKNDMIGRLFRPKKEKTDESGGGKGGKGGIITGGKSGGKSDSIGGSGGKDKGNVVCDGKSSFSISPSEDKSVLKSRAKSPPSTSNRVSAKDSGRKNTSSTKSPASTSSSVSTTKSNGEFKSLPEKVNEKQKSGSSHNSSKSKRSTSPAKIGTNSKEISGITNTLPSSSSKRPSSPKKNKGGNSPKTKPSAGPPKIKSSEPKLTKDQSLKQPKSSLSSTSTNSSKGKEKVEVESSHLPKTSSKDRASSTTKLPSSTKIASKSMPPPPPPTTGSMKEGTEKILSPGPLVVRIPISLLTRAPSLPKRNVDIFGPASSFSSGKKNIESRTLRDDMKDEIRGKVMPTPTSLVGSSVEDVTHAAVVPKIPKTSGASDPTNTPSSKDEGSSRKRVRRRSHSSSKKPKLRDEITTELSKDEVEEKLEKSYELSSMNTLYHTGSNAAKTPPDPPDSSLNPTHSSSPTVTLTQQPQYFSYFEKVEHGEDFFAFHSDHYLNEAKRLKHKADKEETGVTQVLTYMDAGVHFILAGILLERGGVAKKEVYSLYRDTFQLMRHISVRPRKRHEDPQETKLVILNLRIQSVLALNLYRIRIRETQESSQVLNEVFGKSSNVAYEYMPPPITHSPHTSLGTPSPHSPALSPAGSVPSSGIGSVSSQPMIHSPLHQSQQTYAITKHLYQHLFKHYHGSCQLVTAHELWDTADNYVDRNNLQDFFIAIDRHYGPLTLHSSLLDLVRYVRCGLKILSQHVLDGS